MVYAQVVKEDLCDSKVRPSLSHTAQTNKARITSQQQPETTTTSRARSAQVNEARVASQQRPKTTDSDSRKRKPYLNTTRVEESSPHDDACKLGRRIDDVSLSVSFQSLGIAESLITHMKENLNISSPTPVQIGSIPAIFTVCDLLSVGSIFILIISVNYGIL